MSWARADDREAVRLDRRLDRADRLAVQRDAAGHGAAETDEWAAYNAHLAALARRDAPD